MRRAVVEVIDARVTPLTEARILWKISARGGLPVGLGAIGETAARFRGVGVACAQMEDVLRAVAFEVWARDDHGVGGDRRLCCWVRDRLFFGGPRCFRHCRTHDPTSVGRVWSSVGAFSWARRIRS